jgi:hypothetical protein
MKRQVYVVIALAVGIGAALTPARAQWWRIVFSGKGQSTDIPAAHPLSYFIANPFLRDDGGDLGLDTPADRAKAAEKYIVTSEVQRLGSLAGFPIVQILYRVGPRGNGEPASIRWKFLLVQTGKDLYREIYHLQAYLTSSPPLESAEIIKVGEERILATDDSDGGNGGGCFEEFWWFDLSGPHLLDFSQVKAAITKSVPKGATFSTTCSALNLKDEEIQSFVQSGTARCRDCDMLGDVAVHFRLAGAAAVPTGVKYVANLSHSNAN